MSSNNRLLVTFNFHIMFIDLLSSSSLHMCLIRYPQIPMETMAAVFGYHPSPPAYATGVVTRSFSTSIPNPQFPPQQLGIIKSVHHMLTCFTCMSNLPDVHGFPTSRQRTQKECLFLKFFFITFTLFCSTVKLTKLKCTH